MFFRALIQFIETIKLEKKLKTRFVVHEVLKVKSKHKKSK